MHAQKRGGTLKFVPHADLKILDPIWTTAYITRNHGYMIYDTLFALDEQAQAQAADGRQVHESARTRMKYSFTLRDGLKFHDGAAGDRRGLRRLDQALGRQGRGRAGS